MKSLQKLSLSSVLLVSSVAYSMLAPSIAHSIIVTALASLYAYSAYLKRQDTTTAQSKELGQLRDKLEQEIAAIREEYNARLLKSEDEVSKLNLATIGKASPSSPSKTQAPVLRF